MSDSTARVRLADAIQQLRRELQDAVEAGSDEDLRFEVLDLELELQVVVSEESSDTVGAKGGIKFWLVEAGADTQMQDGHSTSQTQTIRIKLRPKQGSDDDEPFRNLELSG